MTRSTVLPAGFEIDGHFMGHGIGRFLHQSPQVHHKSRSLLPVTDGFTDFVLQPGLTFTIEPIVTMAPTQDYLSLGRDAFSIVSPGNPSCQWEHIVLITDTGCQVLTKRSDESHLP